LRRSAQPRIALIVNTKVAQQISDENPQLIHIAGYPRYRRDLAIENDSAPLTAAIGKSYRLDPFGLFQRRPKAAQPALHSTERHACLDSR
jgi:hypothetical protein